jgi:hypothetical protein
VKIDSTPKKIDMGFKARPDRFATKFARTIEKAFVPAGVSFFSGL